MKITKLTIHNFLKLRDVQIDPDKVNVIVGKNKQGKTSILKAIQVALTGKADENMIHGDEAKAEIVVDLDEYRIERSITHKGNYLNVSNKDGWQVPAPQKFLDGLIGHFSFNPIEFFNLKSAEKKKYLLQAIDIRLTQEKLDALLGTKVEVDLNRHGLEVIAELHKHFYSQRTAINASVSKKEKTVTELTSQLPEGFDPAAVSEARINELRSTIEAQKMGEVKKQGLRSEYEKLNGDISEWQSKIDAAKARQEAIKTEVAALPEAVDITELQAELSKLEAQRELVHTHKQVATLSDELQVDYQEQAHVDALVKKLAKEIPDQLVKEAELPVEGLKVEENAVTVNGTDIENLSASEQLTLALAIVRKLNGEFRIICIDGVEILDKETFEWFVSEIEKDDFQYFVTRVDGEKGWIVENGQVKKSEAQPSE